MISFVLETITPEIAALYLAKNTANRSLRQRRVESLARDITTGSFRVTHQCIAFSADGTLLDGQHRLHAIVRSEKPVQMFVARYSSSNQTAMTLPFDNGLTRSTADTLSLKADKVAIATAIEKVRLRTPSAQFTVSEIEASLNEFGPTIDKVSTITAKTVKHRSSAAAKAAVVLLCRAFPSFEGDIVEQFRKFVSLEVDGIWSSAAACIRALENTPSGGGGRQFEILVRVWYALSPHRRNLKIIRIMDESAILDEIHEHLEW